MTTNAAFLDLRRALGAGDYPDSISAALFELRRGRGAEAKSQLARAGEYLTYARQKLKVWGERELLLGQLEASIDELGGLARERLREMLREQRRTVAGFEDPEQIKYLVLSTRDEAVCAEKCRVLRQVAGGLSALKDVIREVSSLRGEAQGSLLEPDLEETKPPKALVTSLLADPAGWRLQLNDMEAQFGEGATSVFDLGGENSAERWLAFLGHLTEAALYRLQELQGALVDDFQANVAKAPMPEPYVIDLTIDPYSGAPEDYEVKVHGAGRAAPANETTVALLKWPIPASAYNNTDLCRFRDDLREEAGNVVIAGVKQAAAEGAEFVILPELSLPGDSADEIERLSDELGVGVIAGREHRAQEDGLLVNEALIHVPEIPGRIEQVKQQPSADEPLGERFLIKRCLNVIRGTALGTIMVVVCSDYLEHDIVSRPRLEGHIDTIVVCSRNGNPDVFERLAIADAIREYCNVIVVNAYPGDEDRENPPSASGTVIAVPKREAPLLVLDDRPLRTNQPLAANAELAFATIDMKAIYSRIHARSDHGYLRPSRYASGR